MERFEDRERLYRLGFSDADIAEMVLGSRKKKSTIRRWREQRGYPSRYKILGKKIIPWCWKLEAYGSRGFYRDGAKRRELPHHRTVEYEYAAESDQSADFEG